MAISVRYFERCIMKIPAKMFGLLEDCLYAWKMSGCNYFLEYSYSLMSNYKKDEKVIALKKQYNIDTL